MAGSDINYSPQSSAITDVHVRLLWVQIIDLGENLLIPCGGWTVGPTSFPRRFWTWGIDQRGEKALRETHPSLSLPESPIVHQIESSGSLSKTRLSLVPLLEGWDYYQVSPNLQW